MIRGAFRGGGDDVGMNEFPCLVRSSSAAGEDRYVLGDPLVDAYLEFVAGRCRPNTLRAVAHDLKTFFTVIDKAPVEVVAADVFAFVADQRGDRTVVRITDGESGLSARTIARRLSSISGLYAYLIARGDTPVTVNPVPRGLSTRHRGGRRRQVPLVRVPRTLPKILSPGEVTALVGALRTHRDRAMVQAMLLGGLRRCEVLGLRLSDVQVPERSLFIAEGKGGHQRVIPISNAFSVAVGDYLAGPNHVLPTGGTARFSSPLGVEDFLKRTSVTRFEPPKLRELGLDVIRLAEMEGLSGHGRSVDLRLQKIRRARREREAAREAEAELEL